MIVGLVVTLANGACSALSSRAADQKAAAREAEIHRALDGMTAGQLMSGVISVTDGSGGQVPGGTG